MKKQVIGKAGYASHVIIAKTRKANEAEILRVYASGHHVDIHAESLSKNPSVRKLRVIKIQDLKRVRA